MWTGQGKASRDGLKQAVLCGQRCDCAINGWRETWRAAASVFTVCTMYSQRTGGYGAPLVAYISVLKGLASLARGGLILYVILLIPKLSYIYVTCIPHVG